MTMRTIWVVAMIMVAMIRTRNLTLKIAHHMRICGPGMLFLAAQKTVFRGAPVAMLRP